MERTYNRAMKVAGNRSKSAILLIQASLVLCALALWEVSARGSFIDTFYYSSPVRVLAQTFDWVSTGLLWRHLGITLAEVFAGFTVGLVLGVAFGFLFAAVERIDQVFQPFISILNAMPRIAFAPLLILWFGFGFVSKVILVVSLVFFITFFNTYKGYKNIHPLALKNARVIGLSRKQSFLHIYLPATLSWIFASLRVSVGFAIIGAILGEYIGANAGIGFLIDNAQSNFDATGVMAGLFVLTLMVIFFDSFIRFLEGRFLKWRPTH